METETDDTSTKKIKTIDFTLCFICQENHTTWKLVPPAKPDTFTNLLNCLETRVKYGENIYNQRLVDLKNVSYDELIKTYNGMWHLECYKDKTNKTKIDRAKKRFEKLVKTSDVPTLVNVKPGRPPKEQESNAACDPVPSIRPKRDANFSKKLCVLCQSIIDGVPLHTVRTIDMTNQLTEIARNTRNEKVRCRLIFLLTTTDKIAALTADMKYHLPCLIRSQRQCKPLNDTNEAHTSRLISDLELVDWVSYKLNEGEIKISINDVERIYIDILSDNGIVADTSKRYKPYLKRLIQSSLVNVDFVRPLDVTKPEQLLSTGEVRRIVSESLRDKSDDDLHVLRAAAEILRKEIVKEPVWTFKGSFGDYTDPRLLSWFCNYLLHGPRKVKNADKKEMMKKSSYVITQHIVQSFRTDRQVSQDGDHFRTLRETPLAVGSSLYSRFKFRSKLLSNFLYDLNIGISYDKSLEIEDSTAEYVYKMMEQNGFYSPILTSLAKKVFHWFALDNYDETEDTANGKNTTHATAIAMFSADGDINKDIHPELQRSAPKTYVRKKDVIPMYTHALVDEPKKQLTIETSKSVETLNPDKESNLKDFSWVLGCLDLEKLRDKGIPGSWGAFNSFVSTEIPKKTSVIMVPPLIRQPPTDINVLYSSLMYIKSISKRVNDDELPAVVTLDLQLYNLAMKLWCSVEEIENSFLFRPGELHIIFWALATVGDYIEGSGIDQAWVEAGMYSATTVNNQILKGKHLYRSLECHFVTIVSIYTLFFKNFFSSEDNNRIQILAEQLRDGYKRDCSSDVESTEELYNIINKDAKFFEGIIGISEKLNCYQSKLSPIQKFLFNYAKQFETIMAFIRASRDRDIDLHLESLESLIKYFFAHDHLNYARLLPLYLATMQKTRRTKPKLWAEFAQGNFCVSKSEVKFTSIGPDHGIEQENKRLKISGGITGITTEEQALQRHFLAAPVLSAYAKKFESKFMESRKQSSKHHDLHGSKPKRIKCNIESLCRVITEHGDPFASDDNRLFNILTHALVGEKEEKEILQRDDIGQGLYEEFCTRLDGSSSVWAKMKKRNLSSFKKTNKSITITAQDGKVVTLKEERNLLQRFIIIARRRTDLDLQQCIGEYEFGVVPRSLFAADGSLLLEKLKSKVASLLRSEIPCSVVNAQTESQAKVLILDGMAVVNALPKEKNTEFPVKTCHDLAELFIRQLVSKCHGYDEVRLVFDRYVSNSLKWMTREGRKKGIKSVQYRITDASIIKDVKLKELLSDVGTKRDLTIYLATKALEYSKLPSNPLKRFMVTFDTTTRSNIDVPDQLIHHDHEEADTLILLHAASVDSAAHLDVCASDTDILLQLVHRFESIPNDTYFLGKSATSSVAELYNYLGTKRSGAIIGFHAFTGCDSTGKFAGRSKEACFKKFLDADDDILHALSLLGDSNELPPQKILQDLERFVCVLYDSPKKSVKDLRWHLYSRKQAEGENLPPTMGALTEHIKRAHFMALVFKRNLQSIQDLPSPDLYGWRLDEERGLYEPIMTLLPPAPSAIINLVKCNCKKGCSSKGCSCRKSFMGCTELCGCIDYSCHNLYNASDISIDEFHGSGEDN